MKKGGGLFFLMGERYADAIAGWDHFAKQWDVNPSIEPVFDTRMVRKSVWGIQYAYTENIVPTPLTEGVKALWVPVYEEKKQKKQKHGGLSGEYPVRALVFDEKIWQVIIRGADTARSLPIGHLSQIEAVRKSARKKGFEKNPPLFGIRQLGKGRAAFSAIAQAYFAGYASTAALEGITWTEGAQGKKSDGRSLFINTLNWLAEPSIKLRGKGSLAHDPQLEALRELKPIASPTDWSRQEFSRQKSLAGVIGARTAYSSGKGTVAQWLIRLILSLPDSPSCESICSRGMTGTISCMIMVAVI